eukprot:6477866-Amphidinium_carterae.1
MPVNLSAGRISQIVQRYHCCGKSIDTHERTPPGFGTTVCLLRVRVIGPEMLGTFCYVASSPCTLEELSKNRAYEIRRVILIVILSHSCMVWIRLQLQGGENSEVVHSGEKMHATQDEGGCLAKIMSEKLHRCPPLKVAADQGMSRNMRRTYLKTDIEWETDRFPGSARDSSQGNPAQKMCVISRIDRPISMWFPSLAILTVSLVSFHGNALLDDHESTI